MATVDHISGIMEKKKKKNTTNSHEYTCRFCYSAMSLVECHGHYHCTRCGMPNYECCDGEQATSEEADDTRRT